MSGLKAIPADAESTKSYQFFRDVCQQALDERAKELGKAPVKFDPAKLKSINRKTGDGEFDLVYEDPNLDFGVTGWVLWRNHEMLIRGGKLSSMARQGESGPLAGSRPLAGKVIEDAVSFTQKVVGKEEFEGEKMEDGIADPRLKGQENSDAVQLLKKECPSRFDQYLRGRHGDKAGGAHLFDPRFIRVVNPYEGDGDYALRFESRANTFFCEAQVGSSQHLIALRSGAISQQNSIHPDIARRSHHYCSDTKALLGKDELLDPEGCKDFTESEEKQYQGIGLAWNVFLFGTAGVGIYRSYTKPNGWLGRLFRLPVLRNIGTGFLFYAGYDSIASNFVDSKSPWRKYGSPIAGGVGMLAPELAKTAVAQRVGAAAMNSRLATGLLSRFAGARAIGGVASKATVGLALVWGMNKIFQAAVGSDYEASVNKRTTDVIYDEWVYSLNGVSKWNHWYDVFAVPMAAVRAPARFIAPDAMEWAVARDNSDIKADIYKQDEKDSEKGEDMMREVLPHFLHASNEADREKMLKLLGSPVEFDVSENFLVLAITGSQAGSDPKDPASIVKALKPSMSDDEVENFLQKFIAYQVQQVAKGLIFVDRPLNNWAREIFTEDGTLRSTDTARTKLIDRWPPPPIPVASPQ